MAHSGSDLSCLPGCAILSVGELRSLVLHFDTDFDLTAHGGTSSRFRTSPGSPPTHWKQTVLYLRRPLPLAAGARVEGTLSLSRNGNYERGYDIAATLRAAALPSTDGRARAGAAASARLLQTPSSARAGA